MEGLEVIKVRRERDEVSRVLGAVELHEVRSEEWVGLVASPSEFSESLLEFGVRANDLVGREEYQDSGSSTGGSGCTRIGRLFLLEGFAGRVPDQPSDAVFVEYPHAGHCERMQRGRSNGRDGVMELWCDKVWRTRGTGESDRWVMSDEWWRVMSFCRESSQTLFYL